jgi:hypothetical protein
LTYDSGEHPISRSSYRNRLHSVFEEQKPSQNTLRKSYVNHFYHKFQDNKTREKIAGRMRHSVTVAMKLGKLMSRYLVTAPCTTSPTAQRTQNRTARSESLKLHQKPTKRKPATGCGAAPISLYLIPVSTPIKLAKSTKAHNLVYGGGPLERRIVSLWAKVKTFGTQAVVRGLKRPKMQ